MRLSASSIVGCIALLGGAGAVVGHSSPAAAQESKLEALRAASRASPGNPAASLAFARALRRAGRGVEALTELRRGLAAGPSRPDMVAQLHWEAARAYGDRHDMPRAMASCKELERKKGAGPETTPTPESHACVAVAYLSWQRATEALTEAGAALAKDPSSYDARIAEGRAYELELKPTDAEAAYRSALALRDGEDAHVALGRVQAKAGQRDEGVAQLRKALELEPSDPDALYELGMALPPGAESVEPLRPRDPRAAHVRRGVAGSRRARARRRQRERRERRGRRGREERPGQRGRAVLAGKVALAGDRPDDALKIGQAALKIVGNNAAAVLLVADSYARKGEIHPALEAYQTAWGLDHADPTPLVHASQACHAASRDTSARAFGGKAAQEFPNWAPGWVALGDALVGQKETKAARDAYRKALAVPDGPIDRSAVAQKLASLQ